MSLQANIRSDGALRVYGTGASQAYLDNWLAQDNPPGQLTPRIIVNGQEGVFTPLQVATPGPTTAPTGETPYARTIGPRNGIAGAEHRYPTPENIGRALDDAVLWGTTGNQLAGAWRTLNDRDNQIAGLNRALDNLRENHSELMFERRNAADEQSRVIKRLERENATLKAEESHEVTALRNQFGEVAKSNAEKAQQISTQARTIQELGAQIERLQDRLQTGARMAGVSHDAQEKTIRCLRRANADEARRLVQLNRRYDALTGQIGKQADTIKSLDAQVERLDKRLGESKDRYAALAGQFRRFVSGINRLVNGQQAVSVDVLTTELMGKAEALLGEFIRSKEVTISRLNHQVADLTRQIEGMNAGGGQHANDHAHINKMASAKLAELRQANANQSLEINSLKSVIALLINPAKVVDDRDDENRYEDDHK